MALTLSDIKYLLQNVRLDIPELIPYVILCDLLELRKDRLLIQLKPIAEEARITYYEKGWNNVFFNGQCYKVGKMFQKNAKCYTYWFMRNKLFTSMENMLQDEQVIANLRVRACIVAETKALFELYANIKNQIALIDVIKQEIFLEVQQKLNSGKKQTNLKESKKNTAFTIQEIKVKFYNNYGEMCN